MASPESPSPNSGLRLSVLAVVVFCLFAALVSRLWFLQVVEAHAAQRQATANGIRLVRIPAPRGDILDAEGQVMVGNVTVPVIDVARQAVDAHPAMDRRLALLLGMTVRQLKAAAANLQTSPYTPVPLLPEATPQQLLYVSEHQRLFPGVTMGTETVRAYSPLGKAAANIVGYVGRITHTQYEQLKGQGYSENAVIGQAGVEAAYDSVLRGTPGVERLAVSATGKVLSVLGTTPPVPGDNLRLTIQGPVQEAAVGALEQEMAIKRTENAGDGSGLLRATGGAVVAEDPRNGTIVALATAPDYNPEQFVGGISSANYAALTNPAAHDPLEDRAIQGQYFPGSTFKLVTATAGLTSGVIGPSTLFNDVGGGITVGGHFFANDGHQSFGEVALPFAITVSDDAFFYHIGETLYNERAKFGPNFFEKTAAAYGFTKPTGIKLPGEASGYVLDPALKAKLHAQYPKAYPYGTYYTGDAIQSAIGEEDVAVTPLQLANAYAAFANGGTRWIPSYVADAETPAGHVVARYPATKAGSSPPLTAADRQAMLQGFLGVTSNPLGTAYGSFGKTNYPIPVAGKTGSAQVVSGVPHTSPAYKQLTSVFTSFAPANNPQYVVDCFMAQAGYGADAAAPVVRQVYDVLFHQPILKTPLSGY